MHVCFHGGGGGGGGRLAKSFNVISDFTKILIGRRGGDHALARRRRMRRCKDAAPAAAAAAAAAVASASAKIAPEEEGEGGGGGKEEEFCDKCCSALSGGGGAEEEAAAEGEREWVAEPEPGVLLTLAPRADGVSNRLRRIRFREEVFDAWAAQCWWADNHDRIAELYCLVKPDDDDDDEEAIAAAEAAMLPATPCQSEAEDDDDDDGAAGAESSSRSPSTSTFSGGPSSGSGGGSTGTLGSPILGLVTAPNTTGGGEHDAVRDQHQPTAATWREWVEEYEPGVFITVGAYPGHRLQLRCVELSREKFGEVKARVWWEENKARLHHLYSF
ncbi:hypothetical protein OsI_37747 [Oryza sativa Indica Group]|uniref:BRX domain-containing protein n=1 Tax=Oryza sativa subsp. indica TaxID=39946 RepID=A2ZIT9_ORYSI|nr:hypothetical protein OsI_37747 [Oryza sativa Indica Group]